MVRDAWRRVKRPEPRAMGVGYSRSVPRRLGCSGDSPEGSLISTDIAELAFGEDNKLYVGTSKGINVLSADRSRFVAHYTSGDGPTGLAPASYFTDPPPTTLGHSRAKSKTAST